MDVKTYRQQHTRFCFDAWRGCEELLAYLEHTTTEVPRSVAKLLAECAHITMGTFYALQSNSINSARFALLCVGVCTECAEVCSTLDDSKFKSLALVCRTCADSLSDLAKAAI